MSASVKECVREVLDVVPFVMRSLRAEFRSHRGEEINIPQYRALMYLRRSPGASLSEVAEHLGITPPSTSRLINDLVERDLIDRQTSPVDRRKITLALTPKGRDLAETSLRETQAAYVPRFAAVPAETRALVTQAMRELRIIFSGQEHTNSEPTPTEEAVTPGPERWTSR
jgi:DNA-binding MarR family transcriptional regulator